MPKKIAVIGAGQSYSLIDFNTERLRGGYFLHYWPKRSEFAQTWPDSSGRLKELTNYVLEFHGKK